MSANSKIEWTDHTFNPWIGCTKVSPGCAHCYAETEDKRRGWTPDGWGKGKPRRRTSAANWKLPLRWNAIVENERQNEMELGPSRAGRMPRPRVFCASLADWLDDEVPIEWLADLLALIHATPNLDWQLLTKRPELFRHRLHKISRDSELACRWHMLFQAPPNVWLGTSVEDQTRAAERIPLLLQTPAAVRFLSCEPLLGDICLSNFNPRLGPGYDFEGGIHWVIAGGESGPHARPMDPAWARSLRDQCTAAGVPFFFKQWGEWLPSGQDDAQGRNQCTDADFLRVGKHRAGRLLDGREWNEMPSTPIAAEVASLG